MLAGAALLWFSCTSPNPDPGLLIVALDGVRADRLGVSGYRPTETPELDSLAENGTRFERAYVGSPLPSESLDAILFGGVPGTPLGTGGVATKRLSVLDGVRVSIVSQKDATCFDKVRFEGNKGSSLGVDIWCGGIEKVTRDVSIEEYDSALRELDAQVGDVVKNWRTNNPQGHVVVVGLRGALSGARFDAELGLTDDWLNVPMIMIGPGINSDWAVDEPVGLVDLNAWLAKRLGSPVATTGENPLRGGSELIYHESNLGSGRFGSAVLRGFTNTDGRYVRGTYGEWFDFSDGSVRPYANPTSGIPAHEATLDGLMSSMGIGTTEPSPPLDPRALVEANSLLNKASLAMERNRLQAAERMIERLEGQYPEAPAVKELRGRLKRATSQ